MVQVPASYVLPTLRYRTLHLKKYVTVTACIVDSKTPGQLDLVRTPTLSSVLLSIACANVVHMLFESLRMSVYYL